MLLALARGGIPVAGFDSLPRYFWTARTPQRVADDLDRLIRYYAAWQRDDVLLIGYSQGADVLPFALNRLPAYPRARAADDAPRAGPEGPRSNSMWPIGSGRVATIRSSPKHRASCRPHAVHLWHRRAGFAVSAIGANHVQAIALPGGHHFGGDYDRLADLIVPKNCRALRGMLWVRGATHWEIR